jgi:hypothetical protein
VNFNRRVIVRKADGSHQTKLEQRSLSSEGQPVNADVIATVRIDDCLESYRTFFDHDWSRRIGELSSGTAIEKPVWTLAISWKAAANTNAMPWLMMHSMNNLWQSFVNGDHAFAPALVTALADRLPAEMGNSLSNMRRKQLANVVRQIAEQVKNATADATSAIDLKTLWSDYLSPDIMEFHLSLWGSQRLCYGAVYHAYENFIRQCVGIARKEPEYRALFAKLVTDGKATFGNDVITNCLEDQVVTVARLARNALAHNGGRMTEQLSRIPHDLVVENDEIQILPLHTKQLFDDLKQRAFRLTETAVNISG